MSLRLDDRFMTTYDCPAPGWMCHELGGLILPFTLYIMIGFDDVTKGLLLSFDRSPSRTNTRPFYSMPVKIFTSPSMSGLSSRRGPS
jgi:hypothetical protein